MPESFTLRHPVHAYCKPPEARLKVLVTGGNGAIGSYFAEHSRDRYDLRLWVRNPDRTNGVEAFGQIVTGEIADLEACKRACAGMDVVVHLAADPSPNAMWASLLPSNIVGTYNIFVAAKAAGLRRVVYASSIHAVSGYASDRQVAANDPPNPGDLYGVTKVFGEAMGRYMAEQEGVDCVAIRIGAFQPREVLDDTETAVKLLDSYVSRRDLNQLLQRSVEAEHLKFAVVHGLSDGRFKKMDIESARDLLGYEPEDDLTEMNADLARIKLHSGVMDHDLGAGQKSGLRDDL